MGIGLGGALISMVVFIIFIALVAFIIPHDYNQNLASSNKLAAFCSDLKKDIDSNMQNTQLQNITIVMITDYSANCSH